VRGGMRDWEQGGIGGAGGSEIGWGSGVRERDGMGKRGGGGGTGG
jgi:hypothetical protein